MQMLMQQVEEARTCEICGGGVDENQTVCSDCQAEINRKKRKIEELADYAARRSQYSYLVHESVMKANEIVIDLNGDWGVRK